MRAIVGVLLLSACHDGPDGVCATRSPLVMLNDLDCPCVDFEAKRNDSTCRPDQRPGIIGDRVWCICVEPTAPQGR